MKKIYLLSMSLFLMVVAQAQTNQELILGNWSVDSTDAITIMILDQEEIDEIMEMSVFFTDEDFLTEFGFAMPQTEEEWQLLAEDGIAFPIDDEEIGLSIISFTEDSMFMYADNEEIVLQYNLIDDSTITVIALDDDDFPFTEFNISSLTDSNLILSFSGEDEGETFMMTMYCSSFNDFILGCTDEEASNYNEDAIINDGSCEYPFMCDLGQLQLTMYDDFGDGWEGSALVINGIAYDFDDGEMEMLCIDASECYVFSTEVGDNMNEDYWTLTDEEDDVLFEGGLPYWSENDVDGDLICDDIDNCIDVLNAEQIDTDADGEGDACDYDDGMSIDELNNENVTLVRMVDVLGKEYSKHPKGELLFYIYSNGVVKKEIKL
jgi:hypothetical protein